MLFADTVLPRVAAHADRFGAISRQIWEHPELGFHESKSSELLQQELRTNEAQVKNAETALVRAQIGFPAAKRRIATAIFRKCTTHARDSSPKR